MSCCVGMKLGYLTLIDVHRLEIFENRVVRWILRWNNRKLEKITQWEVSWLVLFAKLGWSYQGGLRWAGHVAFMGIRNSHDMKMWIRFIWLRVGSSGGLMWAWWRTKDREFLDHLSDYQIDTEEDSALRSWLLLHEKRKSKMSVCSFTSLLFIACSSLCLKKHEDQWSMQNREKRFCEVSWLHWVHLSPVIPSQLLIFTFHSVIRYTLTVAASNIFNVLESRCAGFFP
jgi:hypothetical protein